MTIEVAKQKALALISALRDSSAAANSGGYIQVAFARDDYAKAIETLLRSSGSGSTRDGDDDDSEEDDDDLDEDENDGLGLFDELGFCRTCGV